MNYGGKGCTSAEIHSPSHLVDTEGLVLEEEIIYLSFEMNAETGYRPSPEAWRMSILEAHCTVLDTSKMYSSAGQRLIPAW